MNIDNISIRAGVIRLTATNTFVGILPNGANQIVGALLTPNLSVGALVFFNIWGVIVGGAAGNIRAVIDDQAGGGQVSWAATAAPSAGNPSQDFPVNTVDALTYFTLGVWGVVSTAGQCNLRANLKSFVAGASLSGVDVVELQAIIIP